MGRDTSDDTLIAFALDELDAGARRVVEEGLRQEGELASRLGAYREIVRAARGAGRASAPSQRVLARLLAEQEARSAPAFRPWFDVLLRFAPVAGALVLVVFLGTSLSVMGDALEPHPVVSTGTAPSDALLVASRVDAARRAAVVPMLTGSRPWSSAVRWDTLVTRGSEGDTGTADSL